MERNKLPVIIDQIEFRNNKNNLFLTDRRGVFDSAQPVNKKIPEKKFPQA